MKIVILDKDTLGNDISLAGIESFGSVSAFPHTSKEQINERIADADVIISNKVVIGEEEMNFAKNLKLICVAATGYNNVDLAVAKKKNIIVANVKGYSTDSVAQTVFGYILTLMNSIPEVQKDIHEGKWHTWPVFTMLSHPFFELKGRTLGIIGYGTIGKKVAEIGRAFGMKILICQSLKPNSTPLPDRIDFEQILEQSDILTIHTPLNPQTNNLITANELSKMKSSAILINAARGGVVNEEDLYTALSQKTIRAAGVDVFTKEPALADNKLFSLKNIIITPHTGWTSQEARKLLVEGIVNNIKAYKTGKSSEINLAI